MTDLNLSALVRAELDSSPVADPHIVAEHVLKRIAPRQREAALAQCLPWFVTNVLTRTRNAQPAADQEPGDNPQSGRWRQAAAYLADRYFTADGWKFLRDCTRDDLLAAAEDRRGRAAANIERAEQLEALAALMAKRKASTVGDLPEDDVAAVLS